MAGRFLPQRDVDLITRVGRELVGDKQGNKDGLINQECVIYKPSLQESVTNMYGEAAGGKKIYKNGVQMNALIEAEDFDFETTEFGPDANQNATFSFVRQSIVDVNFLPNCYSVVDIDRKNLFYRDTNCWWEDNLDNLYNTAYIYQFNSIGRNPLNRDRNYWMERIYKELYQWIYY